MANIELGGKGGAANITRSLEALYELLVAHEQQGETKIFDKHTSALVRSSIIHHQQPKIRLLAACCLAEVLRVYAPKAPYDDVEMKSIFTLFVQQLQVLAKPKDPGFEFATLLLHNLAMVRSFTLCTELDADEIIVDLFKLFFSIISKDHQHRISQDMLEVMQSVTTELDLMSDELLDAIFENLIEPAKSTNTAAYSLATQLIRNIPEVLQKFTHAFFRNLIGDGKSSESNLRDHVFEIILELNNICPSVLMLVLPQLEDQLKLEDTETRLTATKVLSKIFAGKGTRHWEDHKSLWHTYLARFDDVDVDVRLVCVKHSKYFLVFHPDTSLDVLDHLRLRSMDQDERVRIEVISAVCDAARENLDAVSTQSLERVCARRLDKKFAVRKAALTALSELYRDVMAKVEEKGDLEHNKGYNMVKSFPSEIIRTYHLEDIETRVLVEKLFRECFVCAEVAPSKRAFLLLVLVESLDPIASTAFQGMLKSIQKLGALWQAFLKLLDGDSDDQATTAIEKVAQFLPEPSKAKDALNKLTLSPNKTLVKHLEICSQPGMDVKAAESAKEWIYKHLASKSSIVDVLKTLFLRVLPLAVDSESVCSIFELLDEPRWHTRRDAGLQLLQTLSHFYAEAFRCEDVLAKLPDMLDSSNDLQIDAAAKILPLIGSGLAVEHPTIAKKLKPSLEKLAVSGTQWQAKQSIRAILACFDTDVSVITKLAKSLVNKLDVKNASLCSTLTALGYVALLRPVIFKPLWSTVIDDFIFKQSLSVVKQEKSSSTHDDDIWDDDISKETAVKVEGIKVISRAIVGSITTQDELTQEQRTTALHWLSVFVAMIDRGGDLPQSPRSSEQDRSRLRLAASSAILRMVTARPIGRLLSNMQFQSLCWIMLDPCLEVRSTFAHKLDKYLGQFKLPIQYLSVLVLGAVDPDSENLKAITSMFQFQVKKRRDLLSQTADSKKHQAALLPENTLPYLTHLLAHHPDFGQDHDSLVTTQRYMDFFLQSVLGKSEGFGFLKAIVEAQKNCIDATTPDNSLPIYLVSDIAMDILDTLAARPGWKLTPFPADISLPSSLYAKPVKPLVLKRYLPEVLAPVVVRKIEAHQTTPSKPNPSPPKAPKAAAKKPKKEKVIKEPKEQVAPSRSTAPRTAKANLSFEEKDSDNDDNDDSDPESEQEIMPKSKLSLSLSTKTTTPKATPASTTKASPQKRKAGKATSSTKKLKKKIDSDDEDDDEDDDDEKVPPKVVNLSFLKSETSSATSSVPKPSPQKRKTAAKTTTATTTKKKLGKAVEEEDSGVIEVQRKHRRHARDV